MPLIQRRTGGQAEKDAGKPEGSDDEERTPPATPVPVPAPAPAPADDDDDDSRLGPPLNPLSPLAVAATSPAAQAAPEAQASEASGASTHAASDTDVDSESVDVDAPKAREVEKDWNWPTPEFSWAGSVASGISEACLGLFFSRVEVVNEENIAAEGPLLLFGNHQSQFVDGMCMMRAAQRPVSFVVAAASMHKPVIGTLSKMLGAVPVTRPQDLAVAGPGGIASIDLAARTITGRETSFSSVPAGHLITLRGVGQFSVEAADSDELLRFRPLPPGESVNLDKLHELRKVDEQSASGSGSGFGSEPPLGTASYKITPKVQQTDMFEHVYSALQAGTCIGIFPEGGSHDRTELLPLKAGVAIMALGAMARGTPLKLVPVGINYFSGHVFRSKVFVDCGKPIHIAPKLVRKFQDKSTRREAIAELLARMQAALTFACLTAPDFETLKVIRTARRMYQNKTKLSAKEYVDLNQRFSHAYTMWKDKPEFKALLADIADYLDFCRAQGLKDKEVRDLPPLGSLRTVWNAAVDVTITLAMAAFVVPLVAPGVVLNLPCTVYLSHVVPRKMKEALAGSTVKVTGRDVAASQQIMLGIKIIPALHVLYSSLWIVFFEVTWPYYRREPGTWGHALVNNFYWFMPLCFFFLGPWYTYYLCPLMGEKMARRWRLLPRYLFCIRTYFSSAKRQPAQLLRTERQKLVVRIQDLAELVVSEMPDWSNDRVINRLKVIKGRSKSIKQIARGNLESNIPHAARDEVARLSFSSE